MYLALIYSLVVFFSPVQSARILGAVFTPSYSHQLAFRPIWRELSLRGHQLTVLTTDPMNDPKLTNLTEIDLSVSYDVLKSFDTDTALSTPENTFVERMAVYMNALAATSDKQFSHPQVRDLIRNRSEHFDLVIIEVIYPSHMAFAARFQAPFIGLVSLDAPSRIHAAMGNPIHPVLYPDYGLPFVKDLTFTERLTSFLFLGVMLLYGNVRLHPREDATIRKHFGNDIPNLYDIQQNMSMLFLNINPVFHSIRPVVPATVYIGGALHFDKSTQKPITQELQDYLDGATNGFVYFSLGTNVKSANLSPQVKKAILSALSEIPYKVLWKFEDQNMSDKPDNVKILTWVPQLSVLSHPNIKVFITQCGLQSIEEAIYYNVPMIGLPFYGDQGHNAKILETKGLGLSLEPANLNKDEFRDAIMKIAASPIIRKNLKDIADLYADEEMSGLDKAIWWIEYVIRHKGAKHLRCPSIDLPLFQYYLLDVLGFIIAVVFLWFYFGIKTAKFVWRRVFTSSEKKKTE